jgi:hypothetical protein
VYYWQRFFSRVSLLDYDPYLAAEAALFLSSKVEETGRRVRDIMNVLYRVQHETSTSLRALSASFGGPGPGASPGAAAQAAAAAQASAAAAAAVAAGVMNMAHSSTTATASTGAAAAPPPPMLQVTKEYWDQKETVLAYEHYLMRAINFELEVRHPHAYVLHIVRELEGTRPLHTLTRTCAPART